MKMPVGMKIPATAPSLPAPDRPPAGLDLPALLADRDERVAEPIQLLLRLALGRLDHERPGHGERYRRRMESVVDDPLGDVFHVHGRRRLERTGIDDALVRHQTVR